RLRKLEESKWDGAIFAAAGLDRIGLRPVNSIELDWMLPAPAQGAIVVVRREEDNYCLNACEPFNDMDTALCAGVERDFLRALLGGCSTPISALATVAGNMVTLAGNILSIDGTQKKEITKTVNRNDAAGLGQIAAGELLENGGRQILDGFKK